MVDFAIPTSHFEKVLLDDPSKVACLATLNPELWQPFNFEKFFEYKTEHPVLFRVINSLKDFFKGKDGPYFEFRLYQEDAVFFKMKFSDVICEERP